MSSPKLTSTTLLTANKMENWYDLSYGEWTLESSAGRYSDWTSSSTSTKEESTVSSDETPTVKERIVRLLSLDKEGVAGSSGSLEESNEKDDDEESICSRYNNIITFAEKLVGGVISEAEGMINKHLKKIPTRSTPSERLFAPRYSGDFPVIDYERPKFSRWPTIEEFTIELGADKIDEYLSSFSTIEEWLYIIYYLGIQKEPTSTIYKYQATWSLPSPEYPVAQATASVFFMIEVSDALPADCLVDVSFNFENHRFKHKPGLTDFNEEWLNYILDSKIGLFKKIKF